MIENLTVVCWPVLPSLETVIIRYQMQNKSNKILYIFDSPRMPYIFMKETKVLYVLHGVNAPDPDVDYSFIEIPITRPIQPGEMVECEVNLFPLCLKNHYEEEQEPTELHGTITVDCAVGWGETPITASEQHKLSINSLLAWQHISHAKAIQVRFP